MSGLAMDLTEGSSSPPSTIMHPLTLEDIFNPFRHLDLSHVYDSYTALVDFSIYTLVFVGAAQATLGHRFPGRAGSALSVGVGVSLALALTTAQATFDFSVRSLGPTAVALLMLLLTIVVYRLLHHAGLRAVGSASVAYITIFLSTLTVAPGFFEWLADSVPLLAVASYAVFVLAIPGTVTALWPQRSSSRTREPDSVSRRRRRQTLRRDVELIDRASHPPTRRASQEASRLTHDLGTLRRALRRPGQDPRVRMDADGMISRLGERQRVLTTRLQEVKRLNEQLKATDKAALAKDALAAKRAGPGQEQQLRTNLRGTADKLQVEQEIEEIEAAAEQQAHNVSRHLQAAAESLQWGRERDARRAMKRATASENAVKSLTRRAERLEDVLGDLTRKEIHRA